MLPNIRDRLTITLCRNLIQPCSILSTNNKFHIWLWAADPANIEQFPNELFPNILRCREVFKLYLVLSHLVCVYRDSERDAQLAS